MAKINLGRVRPKVDTELDPTSNNPVSNAAVSRAIEGALGSYVDDKGRRVFPGDVLVTGELQFQDGLLHSTKQGRYDEPVPANHVRRKGWYIIGIDMSRFDSAGEVDIYVGPNQLNRIQARENNYAAAYNPDFESGFLAGYAVYIRNGGHTADCQVIKAVSGNKITLHQITRFLKDSNAVPFKNCSVRTDGTYIYDTKDDEGNVLPPGNPVDGQTDEWSIAMTRPVSYLGTNWTFAGPGSLYKYNGETKSVFPFPGESDTTVVGTALGWDVAALNMYATAIGCNVITYGKYAASIGFGLYNPIYMGVVVGKYNEIPDCSGGETPYLFAVGTGNSATDRKDGFRVYKDRCWERSIAQKTALSASERTIAGISDSVNALLTAFGAASVRNTNKFENSNETGTSSREVCAGKSSDGTDILVSARTTANSPNGGIRYSTDKGVTWQMAKLKVSNGTTTTTQDFNTGEFEDPVYSQELQRWVVAGTTGIYYSVDGINYTKAVDGQAGEVSVWKIPVNGEIKTIFLVGKKVSYDAVNWKGETHNISSNGVIIPAADSATGFRAVIPENKMIKWCDDPYKDSPVWTNSTLTSAYPNYLSNFDTLSCGQLADGTWVIFAAPTGTNNDTPILFSYDGKSFQPSGTVKRQWETPLVIDGTNSVIAGTMAGATGDYLYVTKNFNGASTTWTHVTAAANGGSLAKCGYYTPKVIVGSDGTKYYFTTGYRYDSGIIFCSEADITKWYRLDYELSGSGKNQFRCPTQFDDRVIFPGSNGNGIRYVKLEDLEYAIKVKMNTTQSPDIEKIGEDWTENDLVSVINGLIDTVNQMKKIVLG